MSNFEVVILDSYDGTGAFKMKVSRLNQYNAWNCLIAEYQYTIKHISYEKIKKTINNSSSYPDQLQNSLNYY